MSSLLRLLASLAIALLGLCPAAAQTTPPPRWSPSHSTTPSLENELVNISAAVPTIVIDLRYATTRNILQREIYPEGMPPLVRPTVAKRLAAAQALLLEKGFRLKIWDAYRPKAAHEQLWAFALNNHYVANPADGIGSLHTWGVAIDATLVDLEGRDVPMPTDFDAFTPDATMHYHGGDPIVRQNLFTLQRAMGRAGFLGLSMEWWHFVAPDWKKYKPIPDVPVVALPLPQISPAPPPSAIAKEYGLRRGKGGFL
ncbi:MAG: M15 family metallopeptidase [Chthoniobacterales bacterium]